MCVGWVGGGRWGGVGACGVCVEGEGRGVAWVRNVHAHICLYVCMCGVCAGGC